ncbi:MAG: acetylglutamate kinase [Verrucomicrobiota bacterium]
MFSQYIRYADVLIEALPYIQKFRGKTVVIKYGGSAMENTKLMDIVLRDIVFLEAVGINPVVVHGGGKAITRRMAEKGVRAKFAAGLRVTDAETIKVVEEVLDTHINPDLVEKIEKFGGKSKTISGKSVFRVQKAPLIEHEGKMVDIGLVGDVEKCLVKDVQALVHKEIVPIISPLGSDGKGKTHNINADTAAAEIAIALNAFKIIYLSDVNGILRDEKDPESTISTITSRDIQNLKRQGVIHGGMLPKVASCLKALKAGVGKVHLLDGRIPHSLLLELFTDHGIGTEIVHA